MNRLYLVLGTVCFLACAEDLPGVVPPVGQLYYPTGLDLLAGSPDTLIVCNSNFDQRFNAGSIMTLDVDALIAAIPAGLFQDEIHVHAQGGFKRTFNFGGDVAKDGRDGGGKYRVFVAVRGRNLLSMFEVNNGELNCGTAGGTSILGTDCTEAYSIGTQFGDPFAVAFADSGAVGVGHLLTSQQSSGGDLSTAITVVPTELFMKRIAVEMLGNDPDTQGVASSQRFDNISGTNALAFLPPEPFGAPNGAFLQGGRRVALNTRTQAALVAFELQNNDTLGESVGISTQQSAGTDEIRGIALSTQDRSRAYVSMRFVGAGGVTSSGVGVVEIANQSMRVLAVVSAGQELGTPTLVERTVNGRNFRSVYVPDIKGDEVWMVDVTTDVPQVIGQVRGREPRTLSDGKMISAHTFDGPAKVVTAARGDKTFAFVINFSNHTLSVFDASDPLAAPAGVLTRFGHALDADGKDEGSQ